MDFTLTTYERLLTSLRASGYPFQIFADFIQSPQQKTIILRHDVDRLPDNALRMARLEHGMGIVATYYFRAVPESWDEGIIREIAFLGHEIGYHYENLSEINCLAQRRKGAKERRKDAGMIRVAKDGWMEKHRGRMSEGGCRKGKGVRSKEEFFELAIDDFRLNLEKLRELYPVKTICMHGSPLSKWDNRDLCKRYNYRDFGIIGEPYFDVDLDYRRQKTEDRGRRATQRDDWMK